MGGGVRAGASGARGGGGGEVVGGWGAMVGCGVGVGGGGGGGLWRGGLSWLCGSGCLRASAAFGVGVWVSVGRFLGWVIMSITQEQQQALDDALVLREHRLRIGNCNFRLSTTFKPKEPTFQVALDVLSLTPFYQAFLISASVPAIYMHEFWATVSYHKHCIKFKMNKKNYSFNLESFRDMLHFCPNLPGQKFKDPPFKAEILAFIRKLSYSRNMKSLSDVKVEILPQPWRTFETIINKYLSGKVTGLGLLRLSRAQIMWGMYYQKNVDYESDAYKTYHDFATGKVIPKPKYVRRSTREKTDQALITSLGKRLKARAKLKIVHQEARHNSTALTPVVQKSSDKDDDDEVSLSKDDDDNADNEDDDGQDDDNEQTESDNDGEDFVHPKFSTHDEEERQEEKDKEEESSDLDWFPSPLQNVECLLHLQHTSSSTNLVSTPTIVPSTSLQNLPTFGSLFKFEDRVKALEDDFSEFKQTNLFVEVVSSIPANTSYAVAANLSELELKKILIDKMENNKLIDRSVLQKNLYKALVDAYESDKDILASYGETVTLKRHRDDEEEDEEPSAGSNWGSKRRKAGKEPESTSVPKEKLLVNWQDFDTGFTKDQPVDETTQHPDWFHKPTKPPSKLKNPNIEERLALGVLLRMFTRSIVIRRRVEDLQLGIKSYQKKLNLTKPDMYRSDLKRKTPYTAYSNPKGFTYQNKDKKNRLMRIDELHKYSDGTLNDAIDRQLRNRRLMRSLEKIGGGRLYGGDPSWFWKDSILQAGNPVKEILLKLNLPDHRILKDGGEVKEFQRSFRYSDTERLSRSDEVLKLKNFKKDAALKLSKSTNQEWFSMSISPLASVLFMILGLQVDIIWMSEVIDGPSDTRNDWNLGLD
ncbi:hypothetical protein Tco_1560773 [Tanacetum coccineum]